MNGVGYLFAIIAIALAFASPKRYGLAAILIGATWVPRTQELEIGPLHLGVVRLAVLTGLLRVLIKGERIVGHLHILDRLIVIWGIWFVGSSIFHNDNSALTRFGEVYTDLGVYFLCRIFLQDNEDIVNLFKLTCWLLVPVAVLMLVERVTGNNLFSTFFGEPGGTEYRGGHYRAHGPFSHAIAAGTIGAVVLPVALYFWRHERKVALAGLFGSAGIVYASGSSGPVLTALSGIGALVLWKIRDRLRAIRWLALFVIFALNLVMSDPVYFLLGRIDITGGSTGYYRAALIQATIQRFNEWWVIGTDYTRDWVPGGPVSNPNQTDMTNEFIAMGVSGGLLLMLLFTAVVIAAFRAIGQIIKQNSDLTNDTAHLAWLLGTVLFAHVVTFFSVSYYDVANSTYFFMLVGAIGSMSAAAAVRVAPDLVEEPGSTGSQIAGMTVCGPKCS